MAEKGVNGAGVKSAFSGPGFVGRSKKGSGGRKHAMKVQLCHAMDQIAVDVKQVIERYAREVVTVPPTNE